MQNKFREYSSIKHFKDATSSIYKKSFNFETQKLTEIIPLFHGTVKMHGTNFCISYNVANKEIFFQKRTSILNDDSKFYDFQNIFYPLKEQLAGLFEYIKSFAEADFIYIYGELVGDNIQSNVALAGLKKRFIIFDIVYSKDDKDFIHHYMTVKNIFNDYTKTKNIEDIIYCIENFPTWDKSLNIFDRVKMSNTQNEMVAITQEVEKECPIGKFFGVSGVGEGVVWKDYINGFRMKIKGDEHSNSKVKTLNGVSQETIESLKTVDLAAAALVSDTRYKQALQYLLEENIEDSKKIGEFIKWILKDIYKEEMAEVKQIQDYNKMNLDSLNKRLTKNAVDWYLKNVGKAIKI